MTLITSLQKRLVIATIVFTLLAPTIHAKGNTLSGRIVDSSGSKVKKASVSLLSDGRIVSEESTGGDGKFKFKKIEDGVYILQASHDFFGSVEQSVTISGKSNLGDIMLSGYRVFGHIKTSQGGHLLTNSLLRKFLADKSNWCLESFSDDGKSHKESLNKRAFAMGV